MPDKSIIRISGASDDLIEIEGDIRDELNPDTDKPAILAFSDGTVLSVEYAKDGCWRINAKVKGSARLTKTEATDPDGDYSDHVTLTGAIRWMVAGDYFKKI